MSGSHAEFFVLGRWPDGEGRFNEAYWYLMRFVNGEEIERVEGFLDGRVSRISSTTAEFLSEGWFESPVDVADADHLGCIREVDGAMFDAAYSSNTERIDWDSLWAKGRPVIR